MSDSAVSPISICDFIHFVGAFRVAANPVWQSEYFCDPDSVTSIAPPDDASLESILTDEDIASFAADFNAAVLQAKTGATL